MSFFRVYYYELVSKSHYIMAVLASIALFRHLDIQSVYARVYIVFGLACFIGTALVHCTSLLWRNFTRRVYGDRIIIRRSDDALRITIKPSRPWKVEAGQFIYLWIPNASFWAFCQSHPFVITWWKNSATGVAEEVELFVRIRDGFTRHLSNHVGSTSLKFWIDGPYGSREDFGDYGSVILFATGPGIAAQIPFAKQILEEYKNFDVRTRRLYLIWQLDREG